MRPQHLLMQWSKGGASFGNLLAWERPMSYQLVGEVMAHQGDDGYRD